LRLAGLGLDVDRPADLAQFIARPSATLSYVCLEECGAVGRLRGARSTAPDENTNLSTLHQLEGKG
jgi:hypothetical protein